MQFNVMKRQLDAKIKASLLFCLFISWSIFTMRDTMNPINITIMICFVVLTLTILHPYFLKLFTTLMINLRNSRITNYEYIEFGENGLYFRYPDLDLRLDTNISEIKISKKGYDYIYSFGKNRSFLIPTEKPFEWIGSDKFSFMYIAKTLAINHALRIPIKTSGSWKIDDVKDEVISSIKQYNVSYTESSLDFSKLLLNNELLIIESKEKNKGDIRIKTEDILFIYEIKSPKTNYWLNIFGYHDSYLVINVNKNWFICKI